MEIKESKKRAGVDPRIRLVRFIIIVSWLLVALFTLGSLVIMDTHFAVSVLIGGALINVSFMFLKNDIEQLLNKVGAAGERAGAVTRVEKIRFFVKFYARLIILALLLIVLVSKMAINMIGLSLGLATVMLSAIISVVSMKFFYSEESLRSA